MGLFLGFCALVLCGRLKGWRFRLRARKGVDVVAMYVGGGGGFLAGVRLKAPVCHVGQIRAIESAENGCVIG